MEMSLSHFHSDEIVDEIMWWLMILTLLYVQKVGNLTLQYCYQWVFYIKNADKWCQVVLKNYEVCRRADPCYAIDYRLLNAVSNAWGTFNQEICWCYHMFCIGNCACEHPVGSLIC